jgi:AAA+ ATPase superfamily predicted ATPase
LYRLADPFLRFWFRFVEPRRAAIEARALRAVERDYREFMKGHLADVWEDLARASVPGLSIGGRRFGHAGRYWGPARDGSPLEIDVVSLSVDRSSLLVGEAKIRASPRDARRIEAELRVKAERLPFAAGKRIVPVVFVVHGWRGRAGVVSVGLGQVLRALRA